MKKLFMGLKLFRMIDGAVRLIIRDGVVEYDEIKRIAVPLVENIVKILGYDVTKTKINL